MKISNRLYRSLSFAGRFLIFIWIIHILQIIMEFTFQFDFGFLGIRPKEIYGLRGIFFAPLIHDDFQHLISNSAPLLFTMVLMRFFYPRVAFRSFIMIYLLTGVAVWLFARPVFHIGASGVVYGLVSFIFWTGIFRRNLKSVVLALIIVFLYSGLIMGILPGQEGISWESHLLGAVVGIFAAYWYKEEIETDELPKEEPAWMVEETPTTPWLEKNTFEKTRQQRALEEEQRRREAERKRQQEGDSWLSDRWTEQ